jgi:hypothetical protein
MSFACSYFEMGIANIDRGSRILSAMQMMHANASKEVQKASDNSSSISDPAREPNSIITDAFSVPPPSNDWDGGWLFGLSFSDMTPYGGTADYSHSWDPGFQIT